MQSVCVYVALCGASLDGMDWKRSRPREVVDAAVVEVVVVGGPAKLIGLGVGWW